MAQFSNLSDAVSSMARPFALSHHPSIAKQGRALEPLETSDGCAMLVFCRYSEGKTISTLYGFVRLRV
ncbi:hypothetical protein Cob_v011036 [Colletotrichum orbiculare MAFF 240422]|uniref:Uncharacterized protein n=1 Tax=Colletotrichum orbiculare (strain 104-T / ATCC 96160 / CBS 514.97 / LARS 414 / MAFF 240422) TaxID=1213857 RepID=A0A484FDA9_COLOR|nr:hypothetical protein Cob_v011036 [Colletotrichum orbiculare MAFF 240422]